MHYWLIAGILRKTADDLAQRAWPSLSARARFPTLFLCFCAVPRPLCWTKASSRPCAMMTLSQPTVELVPPTPRTEQFGYANGDAQRSPRPSPSHSSSVDTHSSSLGMDTSSRRVRKRPSSSETTAATIFSMYGAPDDDEPPPPLPTKPISPPIAFAQGFETPRAPSRSASRSSSRRRPDTGQRSSPGHTPSHSGHGLSTGSIQLAYLSREASRESHVLSPPPIPQQLPQASYLSPANGSKVSIATSPTSVSHRSPTGSLSLSVRRADSEDPDSFHVRATYAALEASGVPGDGVDEGIERTRARIGASLDQLSQSKQSVDMARPARSGDLDEKESQLISTLDRYGFFQSEAGDRLVRMPKAALVKALSVSASAPQAGLTPAQLALNKVPQDDAGREVEVRRIGKWSRMLVPRKQDGTFVQTWAVVSRKESKLRERVYKGIPDRWRGAAWEVLIRRFAGDNLDLVKLGAEYRDCIDRPSPWEIQIDLDVPRTISGHIMFRTRYGQGQRSLFHVLHAFSLLCTDCGYCQGMGPIAATLLCYYEPERVYAFLVQLHSQSAYNMHTIFAPGFPGLLEAIYVQERVTEKMMPAVWETFKKHMISTTSYATKWYITLFSNSVPFHTQLRIWDALFIDGPDVLIVLAVGIIWGFRDQLGSAAASFETVLSLLSSFFVPETDDSLMHWVSRTMSDSRLRADMNGWRQQYRTLVREGKGADALL
ncbi:rab-GTPase-TBC domain-containing protein [Auriculariales sp. MPI-PUGE-AT-0066]|nr:rab-GTPase-TBC domain-containing protein [Auriculariales sp. MPI-PUGE-AT-0066]